MRLTLPIWKEPPVRSYLHYAFPLSILLTEPYYNNWVLNHVIQLVYDPKHSCAFDYHELLYHAWRCLWVRRMYTRDFERHGEDPLSYVIAELKDEVYVIAWIDAFYIPGHAHYQKHHWQHGVLLYGFDEETRMFQSLFFTDGNVYREQSIAFDDFQQACIGELDETEAVYLEFVRINRGACVDYDFYGIQHKLRCYLESAQYDFDHDKYHYHATIESYGVAACRRLMEDFRAAAESGTPIDLRYAYVFFEHKKVMMYRIKMILEEYPIPNYPFDAMDLERVINDADKAMMMCVKWQFTASARLMGAILETMEDLLKRERDMLLPIIAFDRDPQTVIKRADGFASYRPLCL